VAGGGGALAFLLGAFRRVAVRLGVGGSCWRGAGGSRSALRRLLTFCGGLVWFDGFLFFSLFYCVGIRWTGGGQVG